MKEIITVNGLEKNYKDKKVIQGMSFEVKCGEILCFLGPNGAGKSTIINILTGTLSYDKGDIRYAGEKLKKNDKHFKQNIGVVPQDIALYEDLSAEQNLKFFASLYGLKGQELKERVIKSLEFSGLLNRGKEKVNTFSGGMKRRLNIACAIAHQPQILIMDEPTVGIDPQSRKHILESVKKMKEEGMTIIYTTHYMEEVEEISTRILIMDQGNIIATGTKESLKEQIINSKKYSIEVDDCHKVNIDSFYQIEGVKEVSIKGNKLEITTLVSVENLDKLIGKLIDDGIRINHLTYQSESLETVFLNLTGRNLEN
ncbi:ABC-2 type transport system ATP-binding protein [Natranaerovirga hydrolytica]|uniref:ABC-2 type transport system ATP-binding protein n=1 Tax=Natranaerovirga hydrolytica TaxID=680378 RepID=A0A4R1MLB6_9FIRM|nr:ABC transporter ATP-binding protein [Natranaerovirga hydrolytica]TCK92642.1 ABC-2 type transport system ATP-binding protein [Natranaerovirga hydrolytica]